MKRFLCLLVLCLLVLTGCGTEEIPPETAGQEPTLPVQTETPEIHAEADVFYFANELEYNRLYSQRKDGSDLTLILDKYCRSVWRAENTVYFLAEEDLCTYDIPTGKHSVLAENVLDYLVDGRYLVLFRFGSDRTEYGWDMYWRDLETGEQALAATITPNSYDLYDGKIYYSDYNDSGNVCLKAYDIPSGEISVLADDLMSCFGISACEDAVYFEAMDENYDFLWYALRSGEAEPEKLNITLEGSCDVFRIVDGSIYCVCRYYDVDSREVIHRHNPDGSVTKLYEVPGSAYMYVSQVSEDTWLIDQSLYQSWGELNEYGNQEGLALQTEYLLLSNDDSVTSLWTPGVLGSMFAEGNFPVIDSSTARKPVTAELYNLFVKNYGHEGAQPLCSTTHGAWLNIADRKADIALLAAPTEEEQAYLRERGVEIEMKLYGGDGLVFIGNSANPVTNLTHEQIIGIYQGKITNWNEVGGPDHPITVYYRDDQSGSQRLFEKLVFKGLEVPNFRKLDFEIMDEMSTIVNIVLEDPWSIGYSIMTYLDVVYAEEELQVFSVNGVTPSPETVADATYPYHTQGYVVIRSDEPADSPARRLYNWFGCPVSDELLTSCGVSPLRDGVG